MGTGAELSEPRPLIIDLHQSFSAPRLDRNMARHSARGAALFQRCVSPPLPPCGDEGFRLAGWRLQMHKIAGALIPISLGLLASLGAASQTLAQEVPIDRTMLPIPQPIYPPVTELDARNVKPPPFFEVKAPDGAPNVLIVLIDDMGFGQSSALSRRFAGAACCERDAADPGPGRQHAVQFQ